MRIKLYGLGIAQEYGIVWEAAVDVPESSGEAAACFVLSPFTKEEAGQPVSGLGLAAMIYQIGKQGLGFNCRRLGQLLPLP